MAKDKTKKSTENKITPLAITDEMLRDAEFDTMLKESLIREADQIEAELNQDPRLAGVGASDDLFGAIVARLKEAGVWEEDESDMESVIETDTKPGACEAAGMESVIGTDVKPETCEPTSVESAMGTDIKSETGEPTDVETAIGMDMKSEIGEPTGMESVIGMKMKSGTTGQAGKRPSMGTDTKSASACQTAENTEIPQENGTDRMEAAADMGLDAADIQEIYAMLPEKDREDLKLGRKVRQEEQEKEKKRRKRRKIFRTGSVAAAALAVVFGLSMTSEANRRLVMKVWEGLVNSSNYRVATSYIDEDIVRNKSKEEIAALEEIKNKLGAPITDFTYLPGEMKFDGYVIADNQKEAILFYMYGEQIFSVYILNQKNEGQDGSSYVVLSEDTELLDIVRNDQEINVEILETDKALEKPMYAANLEYNDFRYVMIGIDTAEEMKKIAEYLYIL